MGTRLYLFPISDENLLNLRLGHEEVNQEAKTIVPSIDLDKAWHGIHFLLTGTDEGGARPASSLLTGQEIDICSETILSLDSDEVKEFYEHIRNISSNELRLRYDQEIMAKLDIYPGYVDEERLDYFLSYYEILKDFIREVTSHNYALLLMLA